MMIPHTINYIWLSDEPLNNAAKKCISSWKKLAPDFEIVRWTMKDFDFTKMPKFVTEAIEHKKWAFASDYLRLYILYNEGGVYFDSDVLLLKNIGEILNNSFVSSIEYYPELFSKNCELIDENGFASKDYIIGLNIQAAVMASEKEHPFIFDCMKYYQNKSFVNADGTLNINIVAPQVYSHVARSYGFKYINKKQHLNDDILLYPSEVFAPGYYEAEEDSVAIHLCYGSWREMNTIEKIKNSINKNKQLQSLL